MRSTQELQAATAARATTPVDDCTVVGGGIALSLNVAYRICEEQTTFEHGNLPRGVCPVAEFSQTLLRSVGRSVAMRSAWA